MIWMSYMSMYMRYGLDIIRSLWCVQKHVYLYACTYKWRMVRYRSWLHILHVWSNLYVRIYIDEMRKGPKWALHTLERAIVMYDSFIVWHDSFIVWHDSYTCLNEPCIHLQTFKTTLHILKRIRFYNACLHRCIYVKNETQKGARWAWFHCWVKILRFWFFCTPIFGLECIHTQMIYMWIYKSYSCKYVYVYVYTHM